MVNTHIRFGVSRKVRRPHRRSTIEVKNGKAQIPLRQTNKNFLDAVIAEANRQYPGYSLIGWVFLKEEREPSKKHAKG